MSAPEGFGRPLNALKSEKTHWWCDDGRQLCDLEGCSGYVGPKVPLEEVDIVEVCPKCLDMVRPFIPALLRAELREVSS